MDDIDLIVDRYKLKSSISRWRMVTFIALLFCVLITFKSDYVFNKYNSNGYIARVFIDGIIMDDFDRIQELDKIADNKQIKALVIHINSPGGTVVGGENLYKAISNIRECKPVTVIMHESAASAAYLISLAGDRIYASEGTLTGSIGVIMQNFEVVDLINRLGIKPNIFKTSSIKASPNMFEKPSPESVAVIKDIINDTYNQFYSVVKERRGMSDTEMKLIADGRILTGNQALKLKLIDEIGAEKDAIRWLEINKDIAHKLPVKKVKLIATKSNLDQYMKIFTNISSIINLSLNGLVLQ